MAGSINLVYGNIVDSQEGTYIATQGGLLDLRTGTLVTEFLQLGACAIYKCFDDYMEETREDYEELQKITEDMGRVMCGNSK